MYIYQPFKVKRNMYMYSKKNTIKCVTTPIWNTILESIFVLFYNLSTLTWYLWIHYTNYNIQKLLGQLIVD